MKGFKVWYNWPENYYDKDWVSWYVIMRRLLATPFLVITFILFYITVIAGYGFKEGERVFKDVF